LREVKEGKVSAILAKKAHLSPRQYEKARKIMEKAPEAVKEKLRHGKKSIHAACR